MASFFGKVKVPSLHTKSARAKVSARATSPLLQPLKTRLYTKNALREDPTQFGSFGFGDTGLAETPSIIGMGRTK